jgi:hypothetical protein
MLASLVAVATLSVGAQGPPIPNPKPSIHPPELTAPPDANAQMRMHEQQAKHQNFEAANAERKKQLDEASALLLRLARQLDSAVDGADKGSLSPKEIREADQIELLARMVKETMKLTVGGS